VSTAQCSTVLWSPLDDLIDNRAENAGGSLQSVFSNKSLTSISE
jgi:hypothetical protein